MTVECRLVRNISRKHTSSISNYITLSYSMLDYLQTKNFFHSSASFACWATTLLIQNSRLKKNMVDRIIDNDCNFARFPAIENKHGHAIFLSVQDRPCFQLPFSILRRSVCPAIHETRVVMLGGSNLNPFLVSVKLWVREEGSSFHIMESIRFIT